MPYVDQAQLASFIDRRARQIGRPSKKQCTCLEDQSVGNLGSEILGRNRYVKSLGNWMGFGDYTVNTNSLVTGGSNQAARLVSTGAREVRLVYREYIGDVFTDPVNAGAFYQNNYAINPGLTDVARWLSTVVQNYEQWRPNGIVMEFVSTASDSNDSQAQGKIIMATDYRADTLTTKFSNAAEMLAEAYSQESKPSANMIHGIECAPNERTRSLYYTRSGGIPSTSSLSDYDLCQITVATLGSPDINANLGSLYLHWDITLFKPTLFNGVMNKGDIIRSWRADGAGVTFPLGTFIPTLQHSTGFGGGSLGTVKQVSAVEWADDFYFYRDDALAIQRIQFPRWADVGSVWRVTYYIQGDGASTANLLGPSINVAGGLMTRIDYSKTPYRTGDAATACTSTLVFKIDLHNPQNPFGIEVVLDGLAPAGTTSMQLTIESLPNWYTP